MAFIPRLPTWHNTVTVYRKTGVDVWAELGELFGQLYTPLRNQDDEPGGLMYFEFPKAPLPSGAPWLFPRDSFNGEPDVLELDLPGSNGLQAYRVREVRGRWIGFPNEHLICDLQRMTAAEWNVETHSPPPAIDPPPLAPPVDLPNQWILSIDCVDNGTCDDCDSLNGTYELNYVGGSNWDSVPFAFSCSSTGLVYWRIQYWDSSTTEEEIFLLIAMLFELTTDTLIGSWQDHVVDWDHSSPLALPLWSLSGVCTEGDCLVIAPPEEPGPEIPDMPTEWNWEIGPTTDDECTDCNEGFSGFSYYLTAAGDNHWSAEGFSPTLCTEFFAATVDLVMAENGDLTFTMSGITPPIVWYGSADGWDGVTPLALSPDPGDHRCHWGNITLTPA